MRLEKRLELAGKLFAQASAPLAALVAASRMRVRDEDAVLTAAEDYKTPLLVIVAQDTGRISRTPIRNLRLSFTVRANVKTDDGTAAAFDAICAEVEELLDTANLRVALTTGPAVTAIAAGVVTTASAHLARVGDVFRFASLASALNVASDTTYYIAAVPSPTTFTFAATSGGAALNTASAGAGGAVRTLHVFVAVRQPGCAFSRGGLIREQGYALDCKAVGLEHAA